MAIGKKNLLSGDARAATVVLCTLGALISAYLLVSDFLFSGAEFCLTGAGCDVVRESRYSRIAGIPISLLGVLGYGAIAAAALSSLGRRTKWRLLFPLSASAVGFSAYLTYLELFIIGALCSWCVASAAVALLLFLLIAFKKQKMSEGASVLRSIGWAATLVAFVFAAAYSIHSPSPDRTPPSSATFYQVSLAKYLSERGATMYGSYKCGHCERQKQLFGGAFGYVPYVECSRSGPNPNPALCESKNIRSYPTWEIGGERYEGIKTLEQLGHISGYSDE